MQDRTSFSELADAKVIFAHQVVYLYWRISAHQVAYLNWKISPLQVDLDALSTCPFQVFPNEF